MAVLLSQDGPVRSFGADPGDDQPGTVYVRGRRGLGRRRLRGRSAADAEVSCEHPTRDSGGIFSFVATHSDLFDLNLDGWYDVSLNDGQTQVEWCTDWAEMDRRHIYEPGPALHALTDLLRYLPGG